VLLSKDTQGTPAGATAAAQAAIAERADIIIGPLRAQNLQAVQPIAAQAGISVVSFTSTAAVAGPNAFVLGITPESEVERIAAYAARQGSSVLAILAPQNEYGSVATQAMQAAASRNGMAIGPIQVYNPTDADHTPAVRSLEAGGFDTLFVPDGGGSLARVMPFVAYYNVNRGRRVLGTGQWDSQATFGDPSMNGGLFASIDPAARNAFFSKYQAAYGSQPAVVAGLAYDAASMAAALGQANDFSANAIANPNGFTGVYGAYRFGADHVATHALAVLQVNGSRFDTVDPAPTSFIGF
jgi:ABC-type branched-subunit amino acid transport system substrate-binding protein